MTYVHISLSVTFIFSVKEFFFSKCEIIDYYIFKYTYMLRQIKEINYSKKNYVIEKISIYFLIKIK